MTAYGPQGWTEHAGGSPSVTVTGAPLDYQHQFYFSVVAMNAAEGVTPPLVSGPFTVTDPTPPTTPTFCARIQRNAGVLSVQLGTPSTDQETGITGYGSPDQDRGAADNGQSEGG